jgi:flagellar hook-length control protein FliK
VIGASFTATTVKTVPSRPPGLDLPPAGSSARQCAAGSAAAADSSDDSGSFQDALSAAVDEPPAPPLAEGTDESATAQPPATKGSAARLISISSVEQPQSDDVTGWVIAHVGGKGTQQKSADDARADVSTGDKSPIVADVPATPVTKLPIDALLSKIFAPTEISDEKTSHDSGWKAAAPSNPAGLQAPWVPPAIVHEAMASVARGAADEADVADAVGKSASVTTKAANGPDVPPRPSVPAAIVDGAIASMARGAVGEADVADAVGKSASVTAKAANVPNVPPRAAALAAIVDAVIASIARRAVDEADAADAAGKSASVTTKAANGPDVPPRSSVPAAIVAGAIASMARGAVGEANVADAVGKSASVTAKAANVSNVPPRGAVLAAIVGEPTASIPGEAGGDAYVASLSAATAAAADAAVTAVSAAFAGTADDVADPAGKNASAINKEVNPPNFTPRSSASISAQALSALASAAARSTRSLSDETVSPAAGGRDRASSFLPLVSLTASRLTAGQVAASLTAYATTNVGVDQSESLSRDLATQIVQSLRMQWTAGGGTAQIQLEPSHLGEMTISLHVSQTGEVDARLEAASPVVREWLQTNQQALKSALAEHHLTLDRLEVAEPPESRDAEGRERQQQAFRDDRSQHRSARANTGDVFEVVV